MPSAPFRYQNLSQHEKLQNVPPCTSVRLTSDLVPQLVPTRLQKKFSLFSSFSFPWKCCLPSSYALHRSKSFEPISSANNRVNVIGLKFCASGSYTFTPVCIFSDSNIQNGDLSRMYLLLFSDFLCLLKSNFPTRQRIPTKTAQLWDIQR